MLNFIKMPAFGVILFWMALKTLLVGNFDMDARWNKYVILSGSVAFRNLIISNQILETDCAGGVIVCVEGKSEKEHNKSLFHKLENILTLALFYRVILRSWHNFSRNRLCVANYSQNLFRRPRVLAKFKLQFYFPATFLNCLELLFSNVIHVNTHTSTYTHVYICVCVCVCECVCLTKLNLPYWWFDQG